MPHLWSSIKNKLTTYLEMKTNGPGSAQGGTGYCSAARRRSGISPEKPPRWGQPWNFSSQTHYKIKLTFLQLGKNVIFCKEEEKKKKRNTLFFSIEAVETGFRPFRVPFLQAARCRNVPWLALERVVQAQRWRKLVHAPRRREPGGNPASLAGQPSASPGLLSASRPDTFIPSLSCHIHTSGCSPLGG